MELKKLLMVSTAFSALALAGCGGGGGGGGSDDAADNDNGPDVAFTDEFSAKISGDIQAAVRAATFLEYQSDTDDYELLFDYLAQYSSELGEELVSQLDELAPYALALDIGVTLTGTCTEAGDLSVQGTLTDINLDADAYCVKLEDDNGNETGDEFTLSGDFNLVVDEPDYSLTLDDAMVKYDSFDADIADVTVEFDGEITYAETESESQLLVEAHELAMSKTQLAAVAPSPVITKQLTVDADVTFDGFAGVYSFTQTCVASDCFVDAEVIPGNGEEYTIDGLKVELNSGYKGSADISYDDELGELSVSFDQIQYCEDGTIGNGTMNIIDENGAEIVTTFMGCGEEATVEFYADGMSDLMEQLEQVVL